MLNNSLICLPHLKFARSKQGLYFLPTSYTTEPESNRYLDFPQTVHNITCVLPEQQRNNSKIGTQVELKAKMVSFVQLSITKLDTGQELSIYSVGIIRPPEMAKDKVFSLLRIMCVRTLCGTGRKLLC